MKVLIRIFLGLLMLDCFYYGFFYSFLQAPVIFLALHFTWTASWLVFLEGFFLNIAPFDHEEKTFQA